MTELDQDQNKFTKEKVSDSGLTFNETEQFFFTENDMCLTFLNDGIKTPVFMNETKRLTCVQYFLAYYSYDIGNPNDKQKPHKENSFIYLEYKDDKEVFEAMTKPVKYHDLLKWKTINDFEGSPVYNLVSTLDLNVQPFTSVIVNVKNICLTPFRIRSYELYAEAPMPWYVSRMNPDSGEEEHILVHLSMFQNELIFKRGLSCDFYLNNGSESLRTSQYDQYEPIITDRDKRFYILNEIVARLHESGLKGKDNQILVFRFKGE